VSGTFDITISAATIQIYSTIGIDLIYGMDRIMYNKFKSIAISKPSQTQIRELDLLAKPILWSRKFAIMKALGNAAATPKSISK
jgi:hypothetical protein